MGAIIAGIIARRQQQHRAMDHSGESPEGKGSQPKGHSLDSDSLETRIPANTQAVAGIVLFSN
jgi:hypothetical protein